jgi:hypothetical protein
VFCVVIILYKLKYGKSKYVVFCEFNVCFPYILVTCVLFKSNWMYNILFSGTIGTFYNFFMSTLGILLVFLVNYAHYKTYFYYANVR